MRIQTSLQRRLNWEPKEQFRRTITSTNFHFTFKIVYGNASVASVIHVLFHNLKIPIILSDEQSKKWQKRFIYITLFSAILISWKVSHERQSSKNFPTQN